MTAVWLADSCRPAQRQAHVRSSEVKVGRPCNKRWRCCGVQARLLGLAGLSYSGLMSEVSGPADMSQHVRFGHPGGETEAHVTPHVV